MGLELRPSPDFRYALKKGMKGTDVAALQLNLEDLGDDGIFGTLTRSAVMGFQRRHGLEVDGVAGLATQRELVRQRSSRASADRELPPGLLMSIASNESGFAVAAFAAHPSDEGFDLGAFQKSITPARIGQQADYRRAYSIANMAGETATKIRNAHERFAGEELVPTDRRAWELAVLSHNWPTAATNLAELGRVYQTKADDEPEDWIISASGGRLSTAREWVSAYIERATVYVNWE